MGVSAFTWLDCGNMDFLLKKTSPTRCMIHEWFKGELIFMLFGRCWSLSGKNKDSYYWGEDFRVIADLASVS